MAEYGGKDSIIKKNRYASYSSGVGEKIISGAADFKSLEEHAQKLESIENSSGMQEYLETILNDYLLAEWKTADSIVKFLFAWQYP